MKITTLQLSDSEKCDFYITYQTFNSHCYRTSSKAIQPKFQGKSVSKIASFLDISIPSIFKWIKRYGDDGIKGLEAQTGNG